MERWDTAEQLNQAATAFGRDEGRVEKYRLLRRADWSLAAARPPVSDEASTVGRARGDAGRYAFATDGGGPSRTQVGRAVTSP